MVLSRMIGIGVIIIGIAYILAFTGIKRFEKMVNQA